MVVIIILLILLIFLFCKLSIKRLKFSSVVLFTGQVGSGKTSLCISQAIKQHKRELLFYKLKKLFGKKNLELPLLYSNVPLRYKYYIPLTKEDLLREKRFAFKSVVIWSEASLIADSQNFKNTKVNNELSLFAKLIRHELHGGKLFIETQSLSDNHYSIKRVLSNYIYIYRCIKWIPFILIYKVRECVYSYDNNGVVNNFQSDVEDSLKTLVISKSVFKKYDTYTYSKFTDDLDYDCVLLSKSQLDKLDLKSDDIVSFNDLRYLKKCKNKGGVNNE